MNEIRARFRPYYMINLVWLPTVLTILGIWILESDPSPDWAVAAVVMLGLAAGILYMLRRAVARFSSDAMTIDARGIDHWTWGQIPWHEIQSVEVSKEMPAFTFVYMLKVGVRHPEIYLGNVNAIERWLRTKSFKKTSGSLDLLLNGLTENPRRIAEVATTLLESRKGH